jgi:carboxyl-terminal processing protease
MGIKSMWKLRLRCEPARASIIGLQGFALVVISCLAAPERLTASPEDDGPIRTAGQAADEDDYYQLFELLADTLDQIERNYVKPVDRRQLVDAAIRGMLSELDQYSGYIPPKQLNRFRTRVEAEFGGVGIQVTMDQGLLKVISPLVGTPAYRGGLMAGDVILEIDGHTAEGISIDDAVELMQGTPGTDVAVKIQSPGQDEPRVLTLRREVIQVQTVLGDTRDESDGWNWMFDDQRKIGYIRVTAFGRRTVQELTAAMDLLIEQGLQGLVLDLRFNPGGLLSAAVEVCDLFIAEGRIVSTEGRNTPTRSWDAKSRGTYPAFPMVVLINRYSASASEIIAACLQDHQRALIVGERSWGKGSVQNVVQLEQGSSALKLTTSDYRRPNGQNIHRFDSMTEDDTWGVVPDEGYLLKLTDDELNRWGIQRRRKDIVRRPGDAPVEWLEDLIVPGDGSTGGDRTGDDRTDDAAEESDPFVDRQLDKALQYLADRLTSTNAMADRGESSAEPAITETEGHDANLDDRNDL